MTLSIYDTQYDIVSSAVMLSIAMPSVVLLNVVMQSVAGLFSPFFLFSFFYSLLQKKKKIGSVLCTPFPNAQAQSNLTGRQDIGRHVNSRIVRFSAKTELFFAAKRPSL